MKKYIKSTSYVDYRDSHLNLRDDVRKAYKEAGKDYNSSDYKKLTNKTILSIIDKITDNLPADKIKALMSCMDREVALTSDSTIAGNAQILKTPNGFILTCPATRNEFSVFMDNDDIIRRMPIGEKKLAYDIIALTSPQRQYLQDKFDSIYAKNSDVPVEASVSETDDDDKDEWTPFLDYTYQVSYGDVESEYFDSPKLALRTWFKLEPKYRGDVAIMCQTKQAALALCKVATAEHLTTLYNQYPGNPYKLEYLIAEVEKALANGQKYFHEDEYGDQIHPFDFG